MRCGPRNARRNDHVSGRPQTADKKVNLELRSRKKAAAQPLDGYPTLAKATSSATAYGQAVDEAKQGKEVKIKRRQTLSRFGRTKGLEAVGRASASQWPTSDRPPGTFRVA